MPQGPSLGVSGCVSSVYGLPSKAISCWPTGEMRPLRSTVASATADKFALQERFLAKSDDMLHSTFADPEGRSFPPRFDSISALSEGGGGGEGRAKEGWSWLERASQEVVRVGEWWQKEREERGGEVEGA